jgi:hypothetical protein
LDGNPAYDIPRRRESQSDERALDNKSCFLPVNRESPSRRRLEAATLALVRDESVVTGILAFSRGSSFLEEKEEGW